MTNLKRTSLAMFAAALFALGSSANERSAQPQWTDGTKWDSGAYVYDAAGNLIAIGNDAYRYDSLLRLQTATAKTPGYDSNAQQFSYDRYGNILNVTTNGAMTSMAVDPLTNQLDGACTTGGTCIRGPYDSAGNMTALDGTANTYTWDDLGMMTARTMGGTPGTRFVYDANNERVAIITGDSTRYTLRGPDNKVVRELVDTPAAGLQWSKDYVYRGSTLLAAFTAGSPGAGPHRHYHVDHLGTPRMLTDAAGVKLARPTHWPFGREATGSEPSDDRMKFTGHERDTAGPGAEGYDLDYMHARFYDPTEGRFLSVDPVGGTPTKPITWNRYVYAKNRPLNEVDARGMQSREKMPKFTMGITVTAPTFTEDLVQQFDDAIGNLVGGIGLWRFTIGAMNDDVMEMGIGAGVALWQAAPLGIGTGAAKLERLGTSFAPLSIGPVLGTPPLPGTPVYRTFGGGSNPNGQSWTPTPQGSMSQAEYVDMLGLPKTNTATQTRSGFLADTTGVTTQPARPLDGHAGGLPEYVVPNAAQKVTPQVPAVVTPSADPEKPDSNEQ